MTPPKFSRQVILSSLLASVAIGATLFFGFLPNVHKPVSDFLGNWGLGLLILASTLFVFLVNFRIVTGGDARHAREKSELLQRLSALRSEMARCLTPSQIQYFFRIVFDKQHADLRQHDPTIRINVMRLSTNGRLAIIEGFGMDNTPDGDLELESTQGIAGVAIAHSTWVVASRTRSYAIIGGRQVPIGPGQEIVDFDQSMSPEQKRRVAHISLIYSRPFRFLRRQGSRGASAVGGIAGVISIDSSLPRAIDDHERMRLVSEIPSTVLPWLADIASALIGEEVAGELQ